jgi:DNA-binding beta-propeller fold protein YncE
MVRYLLSGAGGTLTRGAAWALTLILLLSIPSVSADSSRKNKSVAQLPPDLLLEGGRKLSFERSFSSAKDIRGKSGFWKKLVDVVAGEAETVPMTRPYGVAVDSKGRVIVTDPGAGGIHIFDLPQGKYKFVERKDARKDPMEEPQCIAVDSADNFYVTDSKSGKIFVFGPNGKFQRVLGSLKGGEGFFKRPTGIAIEPETQQLYVTDTLRDKVYVLDSKGLVQRTIGQPGAGNGEFHYPTELLIRNGILAVVDAMNFRVQIFDRNGNFQASIGNLGDSSGSLFRPKGIAIDSEDHLYLVEGLRGTVQVFDRQGELLYTFGQRGNTLGNFQLPAGIFIDKSDGVYVVDSFNRRVQVFHYYGLKKQAHAPSQAVPQ